MSLSKKNRKIEYEIPKTHPRYYSLKLREQITDGVLDGITVFEGLIAHGRGEAFDYLLGEETTITALEAIRATAAQLIISKNPVISVNGNVAALTALEVIQLSKVLPGKIEVNIFHFSKKRFSAILRKFKKLGASDILGENRDRTIPGLDHARASCTNEGIYSADTVLVPLEDGDRAEALRKMGKVIITIDLNPLSRTARVSNITIVDNLVRALPLVIDYVKKYKKLKRSELIKIVEEFDNNKNLKSTLGLINQRLSELRFQSGI